MLILALDTSLAACSAALFDAERDRLLGHRFAAMERGHSEALPGMLAAIMTEADRTFPELGRIAVTVGPGTFTGVRIGLAMARGLALALAKPVVGLTTLAAIRLNAGPETAGEMVAVAIEARRGEFYLAAFSPSGETLLPPAAVRHADAVALLPPNAWLLGSGADLLLELANGEGRSFRRALGGDVPDAAAIARHAARLPAPLRAPDPLYLRPPDAKPQPGALTQGRVVGATAADASRLAALHARCFPDAWTAPEIARLMAMPGAIALLDSKPWAMEEPPLGFLLAHRAADEAEIITIGTAPEARRGGVASGLVRALAKFLRAAGVARLFIEVAASNAPARALYRRLGFEPSGERRAYYARAGGAPEDAILMRLDL